MLVEHWDELQGAASLWLVRGLHIREQIRRGRLSKRVRLSFVYRARMVWRLCHDKGLQTGQLSVDLVVIRILAQ